MNILLVASIWLAIAALASLLIGGGARVGAHRPSPRPLPPPHNRPSPGFRQLSIFDWAAAANADATRTLLDTRPATVRPRFDSFPERDSQ